MAIWTIILSYVLLLMICLVVQITKSARISAEAANFIRPRSGGPKRLEIKVRELANKLPPDLFETAVWVSPPSRAYVHPSINTSIQLMIKELVEAGKYLDIVIDDPFLMTLNLSTDTLTTQRCGAPRPVAVYGPNSPSSLDFHRLPQLYGKPTKPHFYYIRLRECPIGQIIFLNGLRINTLEIEATYSGQLYIFNSWISQLILRTNNTLHKPSLSLDNTKTGRIILNPDCCSNFFLKNSYIEMLMSPARGEIAPFQGTFSVEQQVTLCGDPKKLTAEQAQSYRNLRRHLEEKDISRAAYLVRAVEIEAEQRHEASLVGLVSWGYGFASRYGNSPERALAFLFVLSMYNVGMIWANELFYVDCPEESRSWLKALCGEAVWSRGAAAFLLAFQPWIDPLGAFGQGGPVVPSSFFLMLWLWVSHLASLVLFALVVVGVRRRMKD